MSEAHKGTVLSIIHDQNFYLYNSLIQAPKAELRTLDGGLHAVYSGHHVLQCGRFVFSSLEGSSDRSGYDFLA